MFHPLSRKWYGFVPARDSRVTRIPRYRDIILLDKLLHQSQFDMQVILREKGDL